MCVFVWTSISFRVLVVVFLQKQKAATSVTSHSSQVNEEQRKVTHYNPGSASCGCDSARFSAENKSLETWIIYVLYLECVFLISVDSILINLNYGLNVGQKAMRHKH